MGHAAVRDRCRGPARRSDAGGDARRADGRRGPPRRRARAARGRRAEHRVASTSRASSTGRLLVVEPQAASAATGSRRPRSRRCSKRSLASAAETPVSSLRAASRKRGDARSAHLLRPPRRSLGVAVTEALVARDVLRARDGSFELSDAARTFVQLGVDVAGARARKRVVRPRLPRLERAAAAPRRRARRGARRRRARARLGAPAPNDRALSVTPRRARASTSRELRCRVWHRYPRGLTRSKAETACPSGIGVLQACRSALVFSPG